MDPDAAGPGILTERDILDAVGAGQDVDAELVVATISRPTSSSPRRTGRSSRPPRRWSRRRFRHLIVVDDGEIAGVLSMRDIVRCWTDDGASCEVPGIAAPAAGVDLTRRLGGRRNPGGASLHPACARASSAVAFGGSQRYRESPRHRTPSFSLTVLTFERQLRRVRGRRRRADPVAAIGATASRPMIGVDPARAGRSSER